MNVSLRAARLSDSAQLLGWKNDPDVRRFSIVTEDIIGPVAHERWLNERMRRLGLFVISYENVDCGDIRFDFAKNETEVSIRIAPQFRSKGIASAVIGIACPLIQNWYGTPLVAKVVVGNLYSMRLFTKYGFELVERKKSGKKEYDVLRLEGQFHRRGLV